VTISANYSTPVSVNGFLCKNCTDVDYAQKHIDPAHPQSGPYGIDANTDPTVTKTASSASVTFGGALSGFNAKPATANAQTASGPQASGTGSQLDISA
jgi:hypothetical protein